MQTKKQLAIFALNKHSKSFYNMDTRSYSCGFSLIVVNYESCQ